MNVVKHKDDKTKPVNRIAEAHIKQLNTEGRMCVRCTL